MILLGFFDKLRMTCYTGFFGRLRMTCYTGFFDFALRAPLRMTGGRPQ